MKLNILISNINQIKIKELDLNLNRILKMLKENAKVNNRGEMD